FSWFLCLPPHGGLECIASKSGGLPAADACLADLFAASIGDQDGLLEIADKAVFLHGAFHAQHHAGLDYPVLVRDEPGRIPAKPDAVAEPRKIAVARETQLLKPLESAFRTGARRGTGLDRGDARFNRGNRSLEGFELRMGRIADRFRTRMVEVIALEDTRE